jgi:ketosteroid isomerase-like protein
MPTRPSNPSGSPLLAILRSVSAENVEIVRRMCEAYARRDWEVAADSLDPDIEWDASTYTSWPDSPTFRGKQGVLDFFRRFLGTWDKYEVTFEEFIDLGDVVVVIVTDSGIGKGSGVEVTRRFAQVWTIRDGKAIAWTAYRDRESALAAAGAGRPDTP